MKSKVMQDLKIVERCKIKFETCCLNIVKKKKKAYHFICSKIYKTRENQEVTEERKEENTIISHFLNGAEKDLFNI